MASTIFAAQPVCASTDTQADDRRSRLAYNIRVEAARRERDGAQPANTSNGDEQQFPNAIGNYTKGLPHNTLGEVDLNAYQILTQALASGGDPAALEKVPMGSADPLRQRKFVNPCAGVSFDLEGADSHRLAIPPAPSVQSAEIASEMVEMYWLALARDVPFASYDSHPMTQAAAAELTKLSVFKGPKVNNTVTPGTLFRGFTAGDAAGPYLSQFLLKPVPFGAQTVDQHMRTLLPGSDFLTNYTDWLNAQNGSAPGQPSQFDTTRRYIRSGRDLAQWVHVDVLYQAYFNAMLMMLHSPDASDGVTGGGMGVPLNTGNPYLQSRNQEGFGTFGAPGIATAVAEVATRALKAVWYQKWFVHRRLRPEAYGGLVHNNLSQTRTKYPLNADILNSQAVDRTRRQYGSYLLPVVFPEGSPLHPSYGAGHATVAGACATILKALFDENFIIANPVVPAVDGLSLEPYTGPDRDKLTVGGELNKLASNIPIGRNFAGVHWRSDYTASLKLGESVAISILRDQQAMYGEDFNGYTFTTFAGEKITVG
jgi:hypothetical protein